MRNKKFGVVAKLLLAVIFLVVAVAPYVTGLSGVTAPQVYAESTSWTSAYTGTYYNGLNTSNTGTAFRSELARLLKNTYKSGATSYSSLTTQFNTTDKDPNGSGVLMFYTGLSKPSYGSNTGGTSNREHVWPKNAGDAFPEKTGPGCDIQHLRPCDSTLNSTRSNYGFGEVVTSSNNIAKQNGSTSYNNLCYLGSARNVLTGSYLGGTYFYPGVGYRGATARILMYMEVMWGDQYSLSFTKGASGKKTMGDVATLLKWHLQEPPTEAEIYRNNAAASIQGNRNPFIDHPEYAEMIFCHDGKSYNSDLQQVVQKFGSYLNTPDVESIAIINAPSSVLTVGDSVNLSVRVTPSGANANVNWTTSNNSVATVSSSGVVTAVGNGSVTITATSKENSNIKSSVTLTVKAIKELSVSGTMQVTSYDIGDVFNPQGLTVTLVYTDGSSEQISASECKWLDQNGNERLQANSANITCKYGSLSKQISGQITVRNITGITVTGTPSHTTYTQGDSFDPGGLTVTVRYNDGTSKDILASNCIWTDGVTGGNKLSAGTTFVVCTKGEFSCRVEGITVVMQTTTTQFDTAMQQVLSATSHNEKYSALKQAVIAYNNLSDTEQQLAFAKYQQLLEQIDSYNSWASQSNQQMDNAIKVVVASLSATMTALIAISFVVRKDY